MFSKLRHLKLQHGGEPFAAQKVGFSPALLRGLLESPIALADKQQTRSLLRRVARGIAEEVRLGRCDQKQVDEFKMVFTDFAQEICNSSPRLSRLATDLSRLISKIEPANDQGLERFCAELSQRFSKKSPYLIVQCSSGTLSKRVSISSDMHRINTYDCMDALQEIKAFGPLGAIHFSDVFIIRPELFEACRQIAGLKKISLTGRHITFDALDGLHGLRLSGLDLCFETPRLHLRGLANCRTLQELRLFTSGTEPTEATIQEGLAPIGALRQLNSLDLSGYPFHELDASALAPLQGLRKLKHLDLSNTCVRPAQLKQIANLPNLTSLSLANCRLVGRPRSTLLGPEAFIKAGKELITCLTEFRALKKLDVISVPGFSLDPYLLQELHEALPHCEILPAVDQKALAVTAPTLEVNDLSLRFAERTPKLDALHQALLDFEKHWCENLTNRDRAVLGAYEMQLEAFPPFADAFLNALEELCDYNNCHSFARAFLRNSGTEIPEGLTDGSGPRNKWHNFTKRAKSEGGLTSVDIQSVIETLQKTESSRLLMVFGSSGAESKRLDCWHSTVIVGQSLDGKDLWVIEQDAHVSYGGKPQICKLSKALADYKRSSNYILTLPSEKILQVCTASLENQALLL